MRYEKVVAVYDSEAHADAAVRALQTAGIPASEISRITRQNLSTAGAIEDALREPGLWSRMFGSDLEKHEAEVYRHVVSGGGALLVARVPETDVARVLDVLEVHKPIDIPERAAKLGITIPATSTAPIAATATAAVAAAKAVASDAASSVAAAASSVKAAVTSTAATTASIVSPARDEVIRLAEEQLKVGKEQVEAGTTRVRRFVIEKPVEANVTLHEEHAEVVRRAITDPSYVAAVDWSDSTIEVKETAERAVVSKTSRIAEEVVIKKEGSDRVETVHDTVRRQQVEVEHLKADDSRKKA
jgi:uncharacterized protein (TIGR02271 family)